MASRTGQTLGNAIFVVATELPAGSLGVISRDNGSRRGQPQPVEQFGGGTLEWRGFAGSGPVQQHQDESEAAKWSEAQRRAISQELLCDVAVLCSEQFDQRGLRERFSQH